MALSSLSAAMASVVRSSPKLAAKAAEIYRVKDRVYEHMVMSVHSSPLLLKMCVFFYDGFISVNLCYTVHWIFPLL